MTSIQVLLQSIFAAYLSSSRCLVLIGDEIVTFQANVPVLILNLHHGDNFGIMFNYSGCQDFILHVKRPVCIFSRIEREIQSHQDRFNKRKYIFLPAGEQEENPFDIFKTNEIDYVSDLLVIVEEKVNNVKPSYEVYSLWTHNYVGHTDYNIFYMLDKWFANNRTFLVENNLFPDKLIDLQGRNLRAAVFPYEPYIIIDPKENGTCNYMGSEMMTLITFGSYHNMTVVPVINEFDYWGDIWENGSGNGLLGNLVDDNADIGAAALYTWGFAYKWLDLSKPTVRTGISCLVPAPKLAAGWLTPLRVYAGLMWLAIFATVLAILIILYLLGIFQYSGKYRNSQRIPPRIKAKIFGKALISVGKSFVMQNVTDEEIPKGLLGRYLMGLLFITTLVLSTTYDSGLATIMTIPVYENSINTIEEFVASGLHWGATQDAWIMSIQNSKNEPNMMKLVSRFVATSEDNLRKFSFTGRFAFSVERLPKDNYAVGSYIKQDVIQNFHLMTDDFYWEQCVLMMRKNSVLLPYVDIFVLRVFEAGLISFWQNEAATQYMDQYVQKAVKYYYHHQKERGVIKLKIKHVQGTFLILVIGNGLAIVVFLHELLYHYFKSKSIAY